MLEIAGGGDRSGHFVGAVIDQMQLVASQFLDGGGVRRASEEAGELANDANITGLRLRCELAHSHGFDHALA
ncbi:hypothetical protein CS8_010010 [Cupriavidus sp. 8B]